MLRGEATNVFILGLTQLVIEPMIYHTSDEQANHSTIWHISQLRTTHVLCYLAKNRSILASIEFTYKKSMKELFRNRKSKKDRPKMTKRIKDKSSTNDLQNTMQKTKHWAATNPTKNHEWTYVSRKGKQLLFHVCHTMFFV